MTSIKQRLISETNTWFMKQQTLLNIHFEDFQKNLNETIKGNNKNISLKKLNEHKFKYEENILNESTKYRKFLNTFTINIEEKIK